MLKSLLKISGSVDQSDETLKAAERPPEEDSPCSEMLLSLTLTRR